MARELRGAERRAVRELGRAVVAGRNSDVTDPLVIRNARGGATRATASVVDRGNAFMAPSSTLRVLILRL
jgi:hypothetical protein